MTETDTYHITNRRPARLAVIQALYQMDVNSDVGAKTVVHEFKEHRFSEDVSVDEDFFEDVIDGVIGFQNEIDIAISDHLNEKWNLKRMDLTLRALLRSAYYELIRRPDVPGKVVISEYVTLASEFFDGAEKGFVNAVLESGAKKIRKAEFAQSG